MTQFLCVEEEYGGRNVAPAVAGGDGGGGGHQGTLHLSERRSGRKKLNKIGRTGQYTRRLTVCPGSSDPPEKYSNTFASES